VVCGDRTPSGPGHKPGCRRWCLSTVSVRAGRGGHRRRADLRRFPSSCASRRGDRVDDADRPRPPMPSRSGPVLQRLCQDCTAATRVLAALGSPPTWPTPWSIRPALPWAAPTLPDSASALLNTENHCAGSAGSSNRLPGHADVRTGNRIVSRGYSSSPIVVHRSAPGRLRSSSRRCFGRITSRSSAPRIGAVLSNGTDYVLSSSWWTNRPRPRLRRARGLDFAVCDQHAIPLVPVSHAAQHSGYGRTFPVG